MEMSFPFEVALSAPQNENSRHLTDMGTDIGEPDLHLTATVNGIFYIFYLELKTLDGTFRKSQIKWNERFDKHFIAKNASRDVAYGYLEARIKIKSWLKSLPKYKGQK
jgi:hypothetical protein